MAQFDNALYCTFHLFCQPTRLACDANIWPTGIDMCLYLITRIIALLCNLRSRLLTIYITSTARRFTSFCEQSIYTYQFIYIQQFVYTSIDYAWKLIENEKYNQIVDFSSQFKPIVHLKSYPFSITCMIVCRIKIDTKILQVSPNQTPALCYRLNINNAFVFFMLFWNVFFFISNVLPEAT